MDRVINAHFDESAEYFFTPSNDYSTFSEGQGPYEYLLGALSGCYYYTLCDIAENKVTWSSVDIEVVGRKRKTIPTTLEKTLLTLNVTGATDEAIFLKCAEEAARNCSIFQTISKVSEMVLKVEFLKRE